MAKSATTTLKLDDALKDRVRQLAEIRQRSPHWVMREAIAQYIDREERREAFRQEALESWKAYHENGLHLTGTEVGAWLETWGTDDEKAVPACHD